MGNQALQYSDIAEEVADFLGYSLTSGSRTSAQNAQILRRIKSGVSRFYAEREWTFLNAFTTITTAADDYQYDLPQEYSSTRSDPVYTGGSTSLYPPIKMYNEQVLRNYHQNHPDRTGRPEIAAVFHKTFDESSGSEWEVRFWPIPDAVYTIEFNYRISGTLLDADSEYPRGAEAHRETIIAACIAMCELKDDDIIGPREGAYQQALARSIELDISAQAKNYGQMVDPSCDSVGHSRYTDDITINIEV